MTFMTLQSWFSANRHRCQSDLFDLLRIASVSADSAYKNEVHRAAAWVRDALAHLDFDTELVETAGHPLVYAQSPRVEGAPTALVYGHYDVQPPDPLDQWISPPFEPTVRDGNVYARGATDDKGQMLTHIKSAQAWIETAGSLPINLKYVIEGEEEVGSESLEPFVKANRERLACDCVVISDSSQFAPGQPAITYGLRGILYVELRLTGPKQDLHSGTFGGGVTNPANALSRMLASLVDSEGRVQVPGFYDEVVPLTRQDREAFAALKFDEQEFCRQLHVEGTTGEAGYTNLERRWARPTCDVNGVWGGYQGKGPKTVLPAKAGAKFSFRLVPNQDPKTIFAALRKHLESICPPGVRMELIEFHGGPGVLVPLDSPYMAAASRAVTRGFGREPVMIREGGSIPIVSTLREQLGADTLLLGWGLNDDNTHSPNEKFCLEDFHRGIQASAYLWEELAKLKTASRVA